MPSPSHDYEIYERKMILKGYGWPQFSADPIGNSTLHQESGLRWITIGDVGYTKKGRFHRIINILRDVFPAFSMDSQICWENKTFGWPITGGSAKLEGAALSTGSAETSIRGSSKGELSFEDGDGAILNLESGLAVFGYLSEPDSKLLGNYMLQNYKRWLSGDSFYQLKPNQLILVTGVYMTGNWEAATFQSSTTTKSAKCSVYRHSRESLGIDWSSWNATNHGYNTGHNHQNPAFQFLSLIPLSSVEITSPRNNVRVEMSIDEDDDGNETLVLSDYGGSNETISINNLQNLPATRSFGRCCRSCSRAPMNQCIFLQGWRIKEFPLKRTCLSSLSEILELKETSRTKPIFELFRPSSQLHIPLSQSSGNLVSSGAASEGIDNTEAELEELEAPVDGGPVAPKSDIYDVVAKLLANEQYQKSGKEPEIVMVHDSDIITFLETYSEELGNNLQRPRESHQAHNTEIIEPDSADEHHFDSIFSSQSPASSLSPIDEKDGDISDNGIILPSVVSSASSLKGAVEIVGRYDGALSSGVNTALPKNLSTYTNLFDQFWSSDEDSSISHTSRYPRSSQRKVRLKFARLKSRKKSVWTNQPPPELEYAAQLEEEFLGDPHAPEKHAQVLSVIPSAPQLPRFLDKITLDTRGAHGRSRRTYNARATSGPLSDPAREPSAGNVGGGRKSLKHSPSPISIPAYITKNTHMGRAVTSEFDQRGVIDTMKKDVDTGDDESTLPMPNHAVLNHLAMTAIKNGVLASASTVRYRKKFITIVYYTSPSSLKSNTGDQNR